MTDDPTQDALHVQLVDQFTRVRGLVLEQTSDLPGPLAIWRPDAASNSIAWLLWHLTRIQDDHVAGLAGVDQAWPRWRERFALPFGPWATGYAQTAAEVGEVRASGELLAGYHGDVHRLTVSYLDRVDGVELSRVVDRDFDPPVTASTRLVSVIGDTLQHLGQAAFVRGLATRAGVA